MSTHNICFYGELMKIILQLSSNTNLICSSDRYMYCEHDYYRYMNCMKLISGAIECFYADSYNF